MDIEDIVKKKEYIYSNIDIKKLDKYVLHIIKQNPTDSKEFTKACLKARKLYKIQPKKAQIINYYRQLIDEKKRYETHYQELDNFNILELISEELQLNFPSIIVCSSCKNLDKNNKYKDQKIRPFKKIRDLIK